MLVEFPLSGVPAQGGDELYRIRCSGVVPVLAHPERYWGCTAEQVHEWRQAGAVIQMDTAGLLGKGTHREALARSCSSEGLVDLFASDNHGDTRTLATARDWLLEVSTPRARRAAHAARTRGGCSTASRCARAAAAGDRRASSRRFRELFLGR